MYLVRRAVERARAETRQQDCYNVCMLTGVLNVARHPSELQNDGVYKNCFLNIPNAYGLIKILESSILIVFYKTPDFV